jgi:hypothetical protein
MSANHSQADQEDAAAGRREAEEREEREQLLLLVKLEGPRWVRALGPGDFVMEDWLNRQVWAERLARRILSAALGDISPQGVEAVHRLQELIESAWPSEADMLAYAATCGEVAAEVVRCQVELGTLPNPFEQIPSGDWRGITCQHADRIRALLTRMRSAQDALSEQK